MLVQGEVGDRNIHSASISTFFWGSPYPYWYTFSCILPYLLPDSILDRVTLHIDQELKSAPPNPLKPPQNPLFFVRFSRLDNFLML